MGFHAEKRVNIRDPGFRVFPLVLQEAIAATSLKSNKSTLEEATAAGTRSEKRGPEQAVSRPNNKYERRAEGSENHNVPSRRLEKPGGTRILRLVLGGLPASHISGLRFETIQRST